MNYLEEMEQKLRALLLDGRTDEVVQFVREQVLASYRNGQARKNGGNGHNSALAAGKLKPVQ
jgi:hypothetical protein